jgi:hypothetical protein
MSMTDAKEESIKQTFVLRVRRKGTCGVVAIYFSFSKREKVIWFLGLFLLSSLLLLSWG